MKTFRTGRQAMLVVSASLALGIGPASTLFAQDQTQQLEEIVVTGSRIARRDFSSQSPIVTVEATTFSERPNIGLEAALNQLPQFSTSGAGTQAQNSAAGSPFPQASSAPGAATINLRGIGGNRSLVLLDGHRVQPVNGLLLVDLNTIPAAALDRVEVITGGAAAVYGADAIAGVVNLIPKKDFEGVELNLQSGIAEEGDGQETSISGILGASFADGRGNVMLGAEYAKRRIILGKDRDWVVRGWDDPGTMAFGIGSSNITQYNTSNASFCAVTNCGQPPGFPFGVPNTPTAGFPLLNPTDTQYAIDQNGNVFDPNDPLNAGHPYTGPLAPYFKVNPDGTLGFTDRDHNYLQLPLDRYTVFGSGHIQLTDRIDVFSEVHFAQTFAKSSGFVSQLFNVWSPTVPYNPMYDDPNSPTFGQAPAGVAQHPVPAALATLLNSRPVPDAPWTYVGGLDYLPNFTTETTTNVYQVVGGLDADFRVGRHDWNWTVYASHGGTTVNAAQPEGFPYLPRIQNLFNADQYGEGFDVLDLPGAQPIAVTGHCTSGLPIFGADGSVDDTPFVSQDCADYVVLRENNITYLTQDFIEGTVTGDLAEMPAGPLQFALGVDYRKEDFQFNPDTGYNANQDYPNVVQNIILPVGVDGTTDVKEIYGEMAIPLVSGRKLVQSFEIDPGVRYSDYDTVGNVKTYKVTADWTVNDKVRVRGGHQFANRAPNTTELFTPLGGSILAFGGVTDACAYYPTNTQSWGNRPENPNRLNVQTLCQYLMTREGAPASLYEPGMDSANNYNFNVFGGTFYFPASIGVTQGNPNLQSESADTTTVGLVLSPTDGLTIAIDWFQIELTDAIDTPGHDAVYQQCLDSRSNALIADAPGSHTGAELAAGSPACALIQREYLGGAPFTPGNFGADRKWSAQYINQGGITSEGIDLQVDWSIGPFGMNVQASNLLKYAESPFPGADFIEYTGTTFNSSFDYQVFSTFRFSRGPLSLALRWQHLPELDPSPNAGAGALGVDSHDNFDLFGSWAFGDRYQLRGGINNLLDADPEWTTRTTDNNAIGTTNANYDQIGRQVFLGLTITL